MREGKGEGVPTEYEYEVNLPNGGYIEVLEDGSAVVYNEKGELASMVSTPWAKDAEGKDVKTWFTTDGKTLTQHVKHDVVGIVYPVTADPVWHQWHWWGFEVLLSKSETKTFVRFASLGVGGGVSHYARRLWVALVGVYGQEYATHLAQDRCLYIYYRFGYAFPMARFWFVRC